MSRARYCGLWALYALVLALGALLVSPHEAGAPGLVPETVCDTKLCEDIEALLEQRARIRHLLEGMSE